MLNTRYFKTEEDISQAHLSEKFFAYFKIMGYRQSNYIKEKINNGWCVAYTVIFLHAMHLEFVEAPRMEENKILPRDDWAWVKSAFVNISRWDCDEKSLKRKNKSGKKLRRDFSRVTQLVFNLQIGYAWQDLFWNLSCVLSDTRGDFVEEYALAGIFTKEDLVKNFLIYYSELNIKKFINTNLLDELIKEDTMVFISTYSHLAGVFKHAGSYYFCDSNLPHGFEIISVENKVDLAKLIFSAHKLEENEPLSLSLYFNIYSRNTMSRSYFAPEKLLSYIQDYDRCSNGYTALGMAVQAGSFQLVKYYLQSPPVILNQYINDKMPEGRTALHYAIDQDLYSIISLLLEYGADPNVCDNRQRTPLHYAINKNFYSMMTEDLISLLIDNGADVDARTMHGDTPLQLAVRYNAYAIVDLLLQNGVEVNTKNKKNISPMMEAILNKNLISIKMLLGTFNILLNPNEYRLIKKLVDNDSRFQNILMNAHFINFVSIIYYQINKISCRNKRNNLCGVLLAVRIADQEHWGLRERMINVIKKIHPLFLNVHTQIHLFRKNFALMDPISDFAAKFNITQRDILGDVLMDNRIKFH